MKADEIKVLQDIKEAVDGYANAFDPCNMCRRENRATQQELNVCQACCYYYASQFQPKENKK